MTKKTSEGFGISKESDNVVYLRRRARDKIINRITASILRYKEGSKETEGLGENKTSNFSFEDIVMNVMNIFNMTRRTALEYTSIALFRAGIQKDNLCSEKRYSSIKMEM